MKFFFYISILLYFGKVFAGSEGVGIYGATNNLIKIKAFGEDSQVSSTKLTEGLAFGKEESKCNSDSYNSLAKAGANTFIKQIKKQSIDLSLMVNASAQGGYYSGCNDAKAKNTEASSLAKTENFLSVIFDPEYQYPIDQVVKIKYEGDAPIVKLTDSNDNNIPIESVADGYEAILSGNPGAVYYLKVMLGLDVVSQGKCCESQEIKMASSKVNIEVNQAPILYSIYKNDYYIAEGSPTNSYKNVGAILLDGKIHCTGTVVGSRTIITAAHCLDGYDKSKMSFVLGSNYQIPDINGGPFFIKDYIYPKGEDGIFSFDKKSYKDDIGIIYLSSDLLVKPVKLYQSNPTWQDILKNKQSLIFVGYGFNVIDGELIGIGIKREGSWEINGFDDKTITFSSDKGNTCKGDSGGPAFIENESSLLLAAITSGGDKTCKKGRNTKIDAYKSWYLNKIY